MSIKPSLLRTGAAAALLLAGLSAAPFPAGAQSMDTLGQARDTGKLKLGYLPAARPFTWREGTADPQGYGIALCQAVAAAAKAQLGRKDLAVEYVAVTDTDPLDAVQKGTVDLLCAPVQPTLSRRARTSFSIPVFPGGTGVLTKADNRDALRKALEEGKAATRPRHFAVVGETASERWADQRRRDLGLNSMIDSVDTLQSGVERVASGKSDALLADRAALLDLVRNDPKASGMIVLDWEFDPTNYALAMRRGDENFRLLVDRALSAVYRSGNIDGVYARYFGAPGPATAAAFKRLALAE